MPSAWTLDSLPNYYPARFLALLCPSQGRKMTVFAFEFKILKATHKAPNCKYMIDYDFIKFLTPVWRTEDAFNFLECPWRGM